MTKIKWITQRFSVRTVDGELLRIGDTGDVDDETLSGCVEDEHYESKPKPKPKPKPKAEPKAEPPIEEI